VHDSHGQAMQGVEDSLVATVPGIAAVLRVASTVPGRRPAMRGERWVARQTWRSDVPAPRVPDRPKELSWVIVCDRSPGAGW
jgi:hypothetical protein